MTKQRWFKHFIFWFGIFLILDGILSIIYGTACLNQCLNNNDFGNTIRILRAIGGAILLLAYRNGR